MGLICHEDVCVDSGSSRIEIRGGEFDAVLLIEGKPLLYHWCDCQGSIAQYLIFLNSSKQALEHFRFHTESGFVRGVSLESRLAHLLPLLAPGEYQLGYIMSSERCQTIEFEEDINNRKRSIFYYPGGECLIETQSHTELSEERVGHYFGLIQEGHRPCIVTISATEGVNDYVIDGHHKLAAYKRAQVPIHYFQIQKKYPPKISMTEANAYVPHSHPQQSEWKGLKKKYDS